MWKIRRQNLGVRGFVRGFSFTAERISAGLAAKSGPNQISKVTLQKTAESLILLLRLRRNDSELLHNDPVLDSCTHRGVDRYLVNDVEAFSEIPCKRDGM